MHHFIIIHLRFKVYFANKNDEKKTSTVMKPHENIMKWFFSLLIRLMEIRYKLYQIKKERASERENHHHYESDAFIYEVCSL